MALMILVLPRTKKGKWNLKEFLVKNQLVIALSLIIFALAFFLRSWGLSSTPDIFGDEALYTDIALKLPQYGHIVAFGSPWFVHPPLYYVLQSAFFQLSGVSEVTLASVFTARLTSCLYGTLAVVGVFVWVSRISAVKIGAATAFVLMVEPYALKYSRIGILESLVLFLAIVALMLFMRANSRSNLKSFVVGGVFFGLAMLTKELAVFVVVVIAVWLLLTKFVVKGKVNVKGTLAFIATGLVMYLGYVVWALSVDSTAFVNTYSYLIQRALWVVKDTGYTVSGYSPFTSDLASSANIYIITYTLIVLAAVSSVYLIFKDKSEPALVLSSWFVGSAIFFGLLGIHNPQFFVYLTIPAAIIAGYTVAKLAFGITSRNKKVIAIATILLLVIINYNVGVWIFVDGGSDTAFSQSINWVKENVPKGETIYVDNGAYRYLLMDYDVAVIFNQDTLNSISEQNVTYYIFSTELQYRVNQDLSTYVLNNGSLMASFDGSSLGHINIYSISDPNLEQ